MRRHHHSPKKYKPQQGGAGGRVLAEESGKGSGGLDHATGLPCPVILEMSKISLEKNEFEVDRMEYYKHLICKLTEKDGNLSTRVSRDQSSMAQDNDKVGQGYEKSFPLFKEGINGLSENKKERLKHVLHEIVSFFTDDVDKVTRDITSMEENGETHQEAVKKFSAELLEKIDKMAQGVDDILEIMASKCRSMITAEKLELSNRIRKLPVKAFDRVVEIINMRRPANESSDKITFNLGELVRHRFFLLK
ncbi:hypothetical protein GUJ93_ZPchr0001g32075 [Zizania palustris]|uniref:NET domain-containing protein n=1 Tax=Zizania palustris TaxID=103762 RepID=A0A8J5RIV0_ZIZPA|nr:hypothetical protein GUJ93_ZPchr0001g32075 [Zizania palustris]